MGIAAEFEVEVEVALRFLPFTLCQIKSNKYKN